MWHNLIVWLHCLKEKQASPPAPSGEHGGQLFQARLLCKAMLAPGFNPRQYNARQYNPRQYNWPKAEKYNSGNANCFTVIKVELHFAAAPILVAQCNVSSSYWHQHHFHLCSSFCIILIATFLVLFLFFYCFPQQFLVPYFTCFFYLQIP